MQLKVFKNTEFGSVRTVTLNDEIMFVGKDIADILEYANIEEAIRDHVDDEDKIVAKCDTTDGIQDLTIINKSGFYSLIGSSKMPNAIKFKNWVMLEILQATSKQGMYTTDAILENPDLAIEVFTNLEEERKKRKKLECQTFIQRQQIAEMKPKASYYDLILQNKSTVPITQIAKDYGMSGRKFNELLHELKVQYKLGNTWVLYQNYAKCGYTQSKTFQISNSKSVMHTYWTQKGRLFLYKLLKSQGIVPVIEQEN